MHRFLKVLFVNFVLYGANHFRCHWLVAGAPFDGEKSERPYLELLGIWVFHLGGRPDFATERRDAKFTNNTCASQNDSRL